MIVDILRTFIDSLQELCQECLYFLKYICPVEQEVGSGSDTDFLLEACTVPAASFDILFASEPLHTPRMHHPSGVSASLVWEESVFGFKCMVEIHTCPDL